MREFDLVYLRKSDNRIFHVKRLLFGEYKIREPMDPSTEKKISRYELRKDYEFQERVSMSNVRERTQPILIQKMA
jgi:hypothetical protein